MRIIGVHRSAPAQLAMIGCAILVFYANGQARAQTPPGTDEVQEDWVLVIQATSPEETAPQIANVISPVGNIDAEYGVLELNQTTQPDYQDGGNQLQRWNGSFLCDYRPTAPHDRLQTANETISYTMTMSVANRNLNFGVQNGKSQTWGSFGGNGSQWRSQTESAYADLSQYDRKVSTEHTRVCFASNLVSTFTQTQVRYYQAGQLLKTDTIKIEVYKATTSAE